MGWSVNGAVVIGLLCVQLARGTVVSPSLGSSDNICMSFLWGLFFCSGLWCTFWEGTFDL